MDASNLQHRVRLGRYAVSAVFFMNGAITGSWAPQIPVFLKRLEITETTLGLLILLFGVGAVLLMSSSGYFIARFGPRAVVRCFGTAGTIGLLLVALAPNVPLAAVAMFLFGGVIGGMDVSMNANGIGVEKKLGRAIMSSLHGFWSLGGFVGGGLGGIVIQNYGHLAHAIAVTVGAALIAGWALPRLYADERPVAAVKPRIGLPKTPTVYLIGAMALFAMVSEGAVLDWSAIYLSKELGADLAVAGFAFAGFAGTMSIARFVGDAVRNRLGAVLTMRLCALVAALGMTAAGVATSDWMAIAAFAFCGIGIANTVPIAFAAAGNQPDLSPGAGISVATTMGYSGILMAPSAIGFVGEHTGFGPTFLAMAVLLVIVALLAGLMRAADFKAG